MSDYFTDLYGVYNLGIESSLAAYDAAHSKKTASGLNGNLNMQDFLSLLVAGFQNQTIDNQADIGEMMNNMVQMSVVTAITNISTLITETSNLSYAASLVGKEVTIARKVGTDTEPLVGTVTGTGTVDGKQVVFLGDDSYFLSDIMAVGRLPAEKVEDEEPFI